MMPNFIELEGNFNTVLNKIAQIILIENALIGTLTVSKDEKDVKTILMSWRKVFLLMYLRVIKKNLNF